MLGSIHILAADTYRLAQKLVSDYGLSGQTRALNSDLQKVFAYMEKNKGTSTRTFSTVSLMTWHGLTLTASQKWQAEENIS